MANRAGVIAALTGLAAVVGVGGYLAVHHPSGPLHDPEGCSVTVQQHTVALSIEQAENASIIAAVAERRQLPARAISIAIATAYQESKLQNLDSGDRDSLGLFQQRPSQGWGTPAQIRNPYYAANAFYDALVQVNGYQDMPITQAAQAVQHSAFPDAYAAHELDGRTIASAMSGYSPGTFSCVVNSGDLPSETAAPDGLTPRANAVRRAITRSFGRLPLSRARRTGRAPGANGDGGRQPDGRALDVFFRPVSAENRRSGWVLAQYLVANASRLSIQTVAFNGRVWATGSASSKGWRSLRSSARARSRERGADGAGRLHRDAVRVVVE